MVLLLINFPSFHGGSLASLVYGTFRLVFFCPSEAISERLLRIAGNVLQLQEVGYFGDENCLPPQIFIRCTKLYITTTLAFCQGAVTGSCFFGRFKLLCPYRSCAKLSESLSTLGCAIGKKIKHRREEKKNEFLLWLEKKNNLLKALVAAVALAAFKSVFFCELDFVICFQ